MTEETRFEEQSVPIASDDAGDSRDEMVSKRRLVLKGSLATLAALGAGTMSNLARAGQSGGSGLTDVDILNFALNLEYLEAEFYLRAVTGTGLSQNETTGTGRQGTVDGGHMVPFRNTAVQQFATEIANDERAHVDFLRAGLGAAAVAEPQINLKRSFQTLGQAAGLGNDFNPFSDEDSFIIGAFVFEDVGVTAYHGAAQYIQNKSYLDAAAGILAVEAYHAGIIRSLMYERGFYAQAEAISAVRQQLSNTKKTVDQGIVLKGVANLVPADKNGLAFERTPDQVLNVVYEGGKPARFGFFPHRFNGTVR